MAFMFLLAACGSAGMEGQSTIEEQNYIDRYLLFSRVVDVGGRSYADLFVSFPGPDGTWQEAVSLGDRVNTPVHELFPVVSPDGEYLFFIRNVDGDLKPHWVRSTVFTELRLQ
jgi:hypothetical protein